jgi:hypothetical protein
MAENKSLNLFFSMVAERYFLFPLRAAEERQDEQVGQDVDDTLGSTMRPKPASAENRRAS